MGMNFADMAHLRIENISEGRIEYKRQKTKKQYSIKITPQMDKILQYYIPQKESEKYIFPIISVEGSPKQEYQEFFEKRRTFNKQLKEIAKLCGIEANLTSYVARHSWATIAKWKEVPIAAISEGLGHGDVKTTEVYLDSFDKEVLDEYNQRITE